MQQHYKVLGILHLVMSGYLLLAGFIVAAVFRFLIPIANDPEAEMVFAFLLSFLPALLMVLSIPGIIAGIGLLNNKRWALILAVVLSIFNLFNFPFGTALSIYSIYVLVKEGDLQRQDRSAYGSR
ncbi:hypothetical protein [Fulvivirga sedimenti]|uniref:DUF4064 domain-containing protein n=1 Tax=Fulvivirga sedimenti TaxID=2879465 RepID=A0A9X1HN01_9BACT|nr:hypothetical protein [Fulvivirga sedimenti]MCA6075189.1 hypothetical protein [Fulvivirga sedimenti]MCA6076366.1 hypothetical protein [Fulvivirga sedimenti]MCA6077494.1 hypothetical protein [Fulvivirga sedimenti]